MPISLNGAGIERPAAMHRNGQPTVEDFQNSEELYRRCSPDHVHEYEPGQFRIITGSWPGIVTLSTVRNRCGGEPDHARWDSQVDPQNADPKLYRDWYVIKIPVHQLPPSLRSEGGITYHFVPKHVPYEDLYSHSEVHVLRSGKGIKDSQFNSNVKAEYRGALASGSSVVLRPGEV